MTRASLDIQPACRVSFHRNTRLSPLTGGACNDCFSERKKSLSQLRHFLKKNQGLRNVSTGEALFVCLFVIFMSASPTFEIEASLWLKLGKFRFINQNSSLCSFYSLLFIKKPNGSFYLKEMIVPNRGLFWLKPLPQLFLNFKCHIVAEKIFQY